MDQQLSGMVIVITGANSGIGLATTEILASQGATVVMACRDLKKGASAAASIYKRVSNADLHVLELDLASFASIKEFAKKFDSQFSRLDVLIENAGISAGKRQLSADGFELNFAVNHLGHFLLTSLLLPKLKHTVPARIIIVSSAMHKRGNIHFEDIQGNQNWDKIASYSQAKLANILFMQELARRLDGTHITVNALHPGVIATDILRNYSFLIRGISKFFLKSPSQGAKTPVYLASAPELEKVSGKYFVNCVETPLSSEFTDLNKAQRLWQLSEQMVGLETFGV